MACKNYISCNSHKQYLSKSRFLDIFRFVDVSLNQQKQPPEVLFKKGALRNFAKFTGTHLCQSLFFNKVAVLRHATLLKKRLWHRYFPVNFAKFLRTPFLQNTSGVCFRIKRRYITKYLWYYSILIYNTAQKMKFSITDLATFTEEICNEKLHFLCSVMNNFSII